jgi:hypothetical protein
MLMAYIKHIKMSTYHRSIDEGARDRGRSIAVVLKLCNLGFDSLTHHTGFDSVSRRRDAREK